jgi:hypothetical protein
MGVAGWMMGDDGMYVWTRFKTTNEYNKWRTELGNKSPSAHSHSRSTPSSTHRPGEFHTDSPFEGQVLARGPASSW